MGLPLSRALDIEMPRRKSLLNPQNRPRNTLSTVNKVKSVFSISKVTSNSRPSHSHGSLSTLSTVIHKHSLIVNRSGHGSLSRHLSRGSQQSNFHHNSRNSQVSSYPTQYSYSTLSYQLPSHITTEYSQYRTASTGSISTRTLVIEDLGNHFATFKNRTSNRLNDEYESNHLLDELSVNFDDMEECLEEMKRNDTSQTKAHQFVTAWRNGLSFPHTKKAKVLTDIPIAATSHCKSGITACSRFCRRHVKTRLATDENLLADLVHKESLERFLEETSQYHATSAIVIHDDLRRKEMYDRVRHADSADKVKDQEKLPDEDDMEITVRFEVPPPVHIDYIPERNLFEKDVQKMTKLHLVTEDHGHIEPKFSVTEVHHNKRVVLKKPPMSH